MAEDKKFPTPEMLKAEEKLAQLTPEEKEARETSMRAELKKHHEGWHHIDLDDDDEAEDTSLLALAEERMKNYDPSKVITQAEIDAEFVSVTG